MCSIQFHYVNSKTLWLESLHRLSTLFLLLNEGEHYVCKIKAPIIINAASLKVYEYCRVSFEYYKNIILFVSLSNVAQSHAETLK